MPARNPDYLTWIRNHPCAAAQDGKCSGGIQASHHGSKGMGQKTDDYRTIPLCHHHHIVDWHGNGTLFGWSRTLTDSWIAEQIIGYLIKWVEETF